MNRIMTVLLASLFSTVDAIRDHVKGSNGEPEAKPEAIAESLGGGNYIGPFTPAPGSPVARLEAGETLPGPKALRKTRKRGRGRRSMVAYRIVKGANKGGKLTKAIDVDRSTLQPTEIDVLAAIKDAGKLSAFQIEAATGHGKKSVESAVWRLRREHGLIESVPNGD